MPQLFGKKLRYIRHKYGFTQVELAHQLLLASYTHITKLEAEQRTPSLDLVVRLAKQLNISTDYFLRDTIAIEQEFSPTVVVLEHDNQPLAQRFGPKLRDLRLKKGWGQTEIARKLGIARRGYISNLETARKTPSLDLIVQIADLFGLTTDDLLLNALSTDTT